MVTPPVACAGGVFGMLVMGGMYVCMYVWMDGWMCKTIPFYNTVISEQLLWLSVVITMHV